METTRHEWVGVFNNTLGSIEFWGFNDIISVGFIVFTNT